MFRDKFKSFVIYLVSVVALLEMYVALFPSISQQAGKFDQILKTMPEQFFKAMNMDPATLSFGNMESYLSTEYMSFLWPIIAVVFAISLANYISVNEIDKGTIETLISLPSKRTNIFVQRYITGLLMLAIFCAVSLFGIVPLAVFHNVGYNLGNYYTATVGSFFFIWAVYSLAILFSAIFSEKGKASMATSGLLILMYVLNVISTLKDDLKNLQYTSFFHYFSGPDLLAKNIYPDFALVFLGGIAIILAIISLVWFNKRDLSV